MEPNAALTTSSTNPTPADDSQRPALPPSPCVGICALKGDYCYGCGRTSDEIAAWGTLSAADQSAVWAELPGRLAAFGFKTFRLAASPAVVGAFIGRTFHETTGRWRLVSASVEGAFSIASDARPVSTETNTDVQATAANGDRLTLIKHEKVRVFGFSSGERNEQMDTVALVLPKGRAQRDVKESSEHAKENAVQLPIPEPFAQACLHGLVHNCDLNALPWPEAATQAARFIADGEARLSMQNAAGSITTTDAVFRGDSSSAANAPSDVKISRAFIAGAIFKADDPIWLAAALAP